MTAKPASLRGEDRLDCVDGNVAWGLDRGVAEAKRFEGFFIRDFIIALTRLWELASLFEVAEVLPPEFVGIGV